MPDDQIESGNPSELAGLLVVNPEEGNDTAGEAGTDDAPEETTGAQADETTDTETDDTAADDAATGTGDEGDDETGSAEDEGTDEQPTADDEVLFELPEGEGKEPIKVTRKEAREGYLRQADYTRKTQDVATAREQAAAELKTLQENRASYEQVLKTLHERLGPADQEPNQEQWDKLRAEDPEKYAVEYADFQRRAQQRDAITKEQERVNGEKRQETVKLLRTHVDGERVKLYGAMPQWKGKDGKVDAKKAAEEIGGIRKYAAETFGYTEAELDQAYDHRMIVMARKAMLYDRTEAARTAAKRKLADAPEIPAPGPRARVNNPKTKAHEEAKKKFDQTGRVEDGVDLLLA